jgi:hypothetical protein
MNRTVLGSLVIVAGCGVGDPGGGTPGDDDVDERIACTAQLGMSGTFTAAAALDPTMGCQPAGTWAVTVTVTDPGDCGSVPIKASYSYSVVGTGHDATITYQGTGDETSLQISAGGDGQCTASFEHINGSGTAFNQFEMHPGIPEPTTAVTSLAIVGEGVFNLWKEHP